MKTKYKDYIELYESAPCKLLRAILEKIENDFSISAICKNAIRNEIIKYFNKERLHKKYTEEEFDQKSKKYENHGK